jgi:hypothetical protein
MDARPLNAYPWRIRDAGQPTYSAMVMDTLSDCSQPDPGPRLAVAAVSFIFRKYQGKANMRTQETGNPLRKRMTRVFATGALIFMYAFGMVATTGAFVTASVSPAFAQRGRGRGRGDGWGRGRGGGGVGAAVGIGVGAAIIGGAIAASAAEQQRQQAVGYCMQRYRSYDPNSQTFLGRDGMRYSCP